MKPGICLVAIGLILLAPGVAELQAQVGTIRGEVTDEEGNALRDVEITIQGMDVRRNYTLKTNREGKYLHAGIPLQGVYRVVAQKEGFRPEYVENIRPGFGIDDARGEINFTLKPGQGGPLDFEMTDEQREQLRRQHEDRERRAAAHAELTEIFNQGVDHLNSGRFQEAADAFQQALAKDNEQPSIWANLGNAYHRLRQFDQAVEAYQKAVNLKPEEAGFHQNLGTIYADMGDLDKAREEYEKAASLSAMLNPREAAVNYFNMGVTFINAGRSNEAIEALEKAVKADPRMAEAYYQLGLTLLGANRIEEAVEQLKKYLEVAPNGPNAEVAKQLIDQLS